MWIRYGGSNRKLAAHSRLLVETFGDAFFPMGTAVLGQHRSRHHGTIPDTPANRAWVKAQRGITIEP